MCVEVWVLSRRCDIHTSSTHITYAHTCVCVSLVLRPLPVANLALPTYVEMATGIELGTRLCVYVCTYVHVQVIVHIMTHVME